MTKDQIADSLIALGKELKESQSDSYMLSIIVVDIYLLWKETWKLWISIKEKEL